MSRSLTDLLTHGKKISLTSILLPFLMGLISPAIGADYFYTVKPGDHPWNLAERFLKRPEMGLQLKTINNIPDDRNILPGFKLRVPKAWLRLKPMQIQVVGVSGAAIVLQRGKEEPLRLGAVLQAPAVVTTGVNASAGLLFSDGSRVLVRGQSEVQLKQVDQQAMSGVNLVELLLTKGALENQIIPMDDSGGRFEIRTPAAVAAVRGTNFRVNTDAGVLRTEVLAGRVSVANPGGEVFAQSGEGSLVRSHGVPPEDPIRLLAAPDLVGLPSRVERLPIDLPFSAVSGAVAYRTQIAASAEFTTLLSDEVSASPRVRARDVEDGDYVIRVRAIDERGLEGRSSQRTLVLHARPAPPILMAPAPDAVVESAQPTFRWTQGDSSWRYRLQVMAESGTLPVLDEEVKRGASMQAVNTLPAGFYRWRVAAVQPGKEQGPWGDLQSFRRVLPGPGVEKPEAVNGVVVLRWASQAAGDTYQIQVSLDNAFTNPLVDVNTQQPQHSLSDLSEGGYHVRVRTIGADGFTGLWGGTQTFEVLPPSPSRWPVLFLLLPFLGLL